MPDVTAGIVQHLQPQSKETSSWQIDSFRTSLVLRGIHSAVEANLSGEQRQLIRRDLVSWVNRDFGPRRPRSYASSKLAIVGMACRLPGGADDLDLFWKLLEEGRDTLTTVPPDRFDLNTHYDPTGKTENATQTPYGNFIDRPGFFDAGFFNMSPREV